MAASSFAPDSKSLFVMVGDMSADQHTAHIIAKLKRESPDVHVWGCGGPAMIAQGLEALHNCEDFTIIGIFEVFKHLRFFIKLRAQLLKEITRRKPSAVMLVDMGTFNLQLSVDIHKRFPDLPILYFISPQVWGSRPWRMNTMAKTISKVLVIFPFEELIYEKKNIPARFVGHPLLKNIPSSEELKTRDQFSGAHGLNPQKTIVAVFPGSRRKEVHDFMPMILSAIRTIHSDRPDIQFVISQVTEPLGEIVKGNIARAKMNDQLGKTLFPVVASDNYNLMHVADLVWVKSGTTALEVTLFGKPMLAFYKADWASYFVWCMFKRVKYIVWPNMLAGEGLVPELIQLDCRAEQLVKYTRDLLDVPTLRSQISARLLTLRDQLGQGDYAANVAEEILCAIGKPTNKVTSG